MNQEKITDGTAIKLRNLKPFKSGKDWNGNALGRPKGSISPIGEIKKIFKEDPVRFQEFINAYLRDPHNRQHIVEMIDGRPGGLEVNIDNRSITFIGSQEQNQAIDEFVIERYRQLKEEGKV